MRFENYTFVKIQSINIRQVQSVPSSPGVIIECLNRNRSFHSEYEVEAVIRYAIFIHFSGQIWSVKCL